MIINTPTGKIITNNQTCGQSCSFLCIFESLGCVKYYCGKFGVWLIKRKGKPRIASICDEITTLKKQAKGLTIKP